MLTPGQVHLLDSWLGEWHVVADLSWPLQDTRVLRVSSRRGEHIVKAARSGRPVSHHFTREIDAHLGVLAGLARSGADMPVPALEYHDRALGLIVTRFVPGSLVLGTADEADPQIFEQAGRILARLHVPGEISPEYGSSIVAATRALVGQARGLVADDRLDGLLALLARLSAPDAAARRPVRLVFTHGDFQPRNWLVHDGRVSVIDFGRAAQRSWVSDLVRLRNQQFVGRSDLSETFDAGLARPLTADDRELLTLETVRDAVGTVVWAHGIGDDDFEAHGRAMVERVLGGV